jgi:putative ABC transport system permease protein
MGMVLFKSIFRSLQKRKGYSVLSIITLSVGFSAFIIISLFIKYELNWDRFNEHYENIYRIQTYKVNEDEYMMQSPPAINDFIQNKYHDILNQSLVFSDQRLFLSATKEQNPLELDGQFADQAYLDMFTYDFISGNADNALLEPMSVILSETAVQMLFGDRDFSNRTIWLEKKYPLKVTGIYRDLPKDAHMRPEFVISINSLKRIWHNPRLFEDWNNLAYFNYVQTSDQADINHLNTDLKELLYDKVLTDKR